MIGIKFKLMQTEEDEKLSKILGYLIASSIEIFNQTGKIGHIFTPAGTSHNINNAIQICGFTEAFDLWGCGIFEGYKDIQLLFDDGIMGGKSHHFNLRNCCKCYRNPCQCENKNHDVAFSIPFNIKRAVDLKNRLEIKEIE